jgi:hypothetical protein
MGHPYTDTIRRTTSPVKTVQQSTVQQQNRAANTVPQTTLPLSQDRLTIVEQHFMTDTGSEHVVDFL